MISSNILNGISGLLEGQEGSGSTSPIAAVFWTLVIEDRRNSSEICLDGIM